MASEHISIDNDLLSENEVIAKLLSQDYQLIFTHQEIQTDDIESLYVGTESLRVNSDAMVVPANKTETMFQEMAGFSFVVLRDIGIWQQIVEDNIPNAKFIYQDEVDDFNEIRTSLRIKPSIAPPNNFEVINSLKRATTIAILTSFPINFPSNVVMIFSP